jgi:sulfate permease, SulP family
LSLALSGWLSFRNLGTPGVTGSVTPDGSNYTNLIRSIIPALEWLRTYERKDLNGDLSAGVIVAIMLIPQGMAYAMLAGLPPVIGLYASTFPLVIYALFGSSRQLAVGPVAIMSLLVFAGLSSLAEPGSEEYVKLVLLLAFMVGVMKLCLGFFRFGFFVNFFSHAVISGFSSAAAIVICLSQLHHLLGVKFQSTHSIFPLLVEVSQRIGETNWPTFAVGCASLVCLVFVRSQFPRFPAPLLVVVAGTLLTQALKLDQMGVKIVGEVPRGLPGFSLPSFSMESVKQLVPLSLTVLFVGFMESISVAKWIASKEKVKVDSNQELKALGLANVAASFFSGYPVTGGFSRTAVNYQSGARTGLASLVTVGVILLILLFFTPLFHFLPNAVLASIVMAAVVGLVDLREAKHLFGIKKIDGWMWVVTFGATLILGSEKGILLGVVFSLLVFIWRSAHPHTAELGYLEKEGVFRNVKRYPEAITYPGALILRVDASLYFANMSYLEDLLRRNMSGRSDVQWVILDFSGVNDIDDVAIDVLDEMMAHYRNQGIHFLIANMKGPVRDLVAKAGWGDKYGQRMTYLSIQQALEDVGLTQKVSLKHP